MFPKKPSKLQVSSWTVGGVFFEKRILDLSLLTFLARELAKVSEHILNCLAMVREAYPKRIRSFVKNKWVKAGPVLEALTAFQVLLVVFSWMRSPRYSRHRMNMYGEMGSPWRIPRDGRKGSSLPPLKRIVVEVDEMHSMIIVIRFRGKLKSIRTSRIKLHSNLSKAFSRSILSPITPVRPFFFPME